MAREDLDWGGNPLRSEPKLVEVEGIVQRMVWVKAKAWFELEDKVQVELRGMSRVGVWSSLRQLELVELEGKQQLEVKGSWHLLEEGDRGTRSRFENSGWGAWSSLRSIISRSKDQTRYAKTFLTSLSSLASLFLKGNSSHFLVLVEHIWLRDTRPRTHQTKEDLLPCSFISSVLYQVLVTTLFFGFLKEYPNYIEAEWLLRSSFHFSKNDWLF